MRAQLQSLKKLRELAFDAKGCRWHKVRSFWSEVRDGEKLLDEDDDDDDDSSWTCGKCDCCLRDKAKLQPRSFEHITLVVLLMIEEASKGLPHSKRATCRPLRPRSLPWLRLWSLPSAVQSPLHSPFGLTPCRAPLAFR